MLIPFGNGKLAQKGRAFASKRNAVIFCFLDSGGQCAGTAMTSHSWSSLLWEDARAIEDRGFP
jgi:hypothetical protein